MKLMVKGLSLLTLLVLAASPALADESLEPVKQKLAEDFPRLEYQNLATTPVDGMYEVFVSGQMIYYFPASSHLLLGNLFDSAGTNLTEASQMRLVDELLANLPLDKAVKIGSGPKTVIEVTDPDCPFCRKASKFFEGKEELVTRYVFFFPLQELHPNAAAKAAYVLSSEDRVTSYHEVMTGKYDKQPLPQFEDNRQLVDHFELGMKLGIRGTPRFWVDGEVVDGANIPELARLLGVELPPETPAAKPAEAKD